MSKVLFSLLFLGSFSVLAEEIVTESMDELDAHVTASIPSHREARNAQLEQEAIQIEQQEIARSIASEENGSDFENEESLIEN
ncbi:MAG: hypothetical protein KBD63_04130 [Bacteriovoracaceae bacterium]|nr:hypothetical protein [Bacteriovoracaceae bacterium]